jgi:hypothetical protein
MLLRTVNGKHYAGVAISDVYFSLDRHIEDRVKKKKHTIEST